MIKHIHDRLIRWSQQVADRDESGFSRCSVFDMLRNYGTMVGSSAYQDFCPLDSEGQETDKVVSALDEYNKKTVLVFYLQGLDSTLEQQAQSLSCSIATLYRRVDAAHILINQQLKSLRSIRSYRTYEQA